MSTTQRQHLQNQTGLEKQCEKHGTYQAKSHVVLGKTMFTSCPQCDLEYKKSQNKIDEIELKLNNEKMLHESGIPLRFLPCRFNNFVVDNNDNKIKAFKISKLYAEKIKERFQFGGGLVFCGVPGTGKTHLACAIGMHALKNNFKVIYTSAYKAIAKIKSTYSRDSKFTIEQTLESFVKPDFLILDEVGVQFGSEVETMLLYQILNGRYENLKPTIMLSNLNEQDLTKFIGERCLDRMKEGGGAFLNFDWESYRLKNKKPIAGSINKERSNDGK